MTVLWAIIVIIAIFTALTLYRNLAVLQYRLVPPPPDKDDAHELVLVTIPARNEASNIRDCVQSVLGQAYRPLQIIAVNDNSTDATGAILAEMAAGSPELEIIQGKPLPPGWAGKNYAISQGVAGARGRWLVFMDADTRLSPDAIGRAVALMRQRDLAMLSYLPRHILGSFWEKVVQPVVMGYVLSGAPPSMTEDPKSGTAAAFGQFVVFDRTAYDRIGGHEGVKGEVLEDWRMAQKIKAEGLRLGMAEGQDLSSVRMYTSLAGLWEGWTKNAFLGADKRLDLLALLLFTVFVLGIWPVVLAIWAVVAAISGASGVLPLAIAAVYQLGIMLYYATWMNRRMRMPASNAIGFPLGSIIFEGILVNSAYRVLSGRGVSWKGRTYSDQ